jgi:tripartite-type tricarboxylate transporter receptor subunit TctC
LLSEQVEALTPGLAAAMPYIRRKQIKPLAVTGLARHPLVPDVPTFEEAGFKGFDGVQWYGIVGPARLPAEITATLHAEISKALASPAFQQRLATEAIDPMPMSPAEFGDFIRSEIARYRALARERKLSLDD